MIDVDYPQLLKLFPEHLDPKRSESAAFLIWYLDNYYRLDQTEAVDSVCDQSGDKGVDGIFVNDNDQTITIAKAIQGVARNIRTAAASCLPTPIPPLFAEGNTPSSRVVSISRSPPARRRPTNAPARPAPFFPRF